MKLKFWFSCDDNDFEVLPGQMVSDVYDYKNIEFSLSSGASFKKKKCNVLAEVETDTGEIINIIEEIKPESFISNKQKDAIKKENVSIIKRGLKQKTQTVQKPPTLFLNDTVWDLAVTALEIGRYPLFIGPKGAGKTETAYSLAHATGREMLPMNCGAIFKPKQTLIGSMQAKDGTTFLVSSEFLKAFTSEKPTLIFLDEISRIPAAAANYMMTILDRKQSYVYVEEEGVRYCKGKDVVFVAAANFGFEYTDTRNQDGAFLDRFIKFMVDYLDEKEEVELLAQRVTGVPVADLKLLVKKANQCRVSVNELRVGVSPRQLIDMAEFLKQGFSMSDVLEHVFLNLFINGSCDTRDDVRKLIDLDN